MLDYESDEHEEQPMVNTAGPSMNSLNITAASIGPSEKEDCRMISARTVAADSEPMFVEANDTRQDLDPIYYQCRAARTSSFGDNLVSVSLDESFGKKNPFYLPVHRQF